MRSGRLRPSGGCWSCATNTTFAPAEKSEAASPIKRKRGFLVLIIIAVAAVADQILEGAGRGENDTYDDTADQADKAQDNARQGHALLGRALGTGHKAEYDAQNGHDTAAAEQAHNPQYHSGDGHGVAGQLLLLGRQAVIGDIAGLAVEAGLGRIGRRRLAALEAAVYRLTAHWLLTKGLGRIRRLRGRGNRGLLRRNRRLCA